MPERQVTEVEGRRLVLSHLDKVLWPATGWTKGEALYYYAQVAPALLPHLRGRPATFLRFPAGIGEEGFFAKNPPPGLPAWVRTVTAPSHEGPKERVAVDDLATLMTVANGYALELHVPQWTADTGPDHHDRLVVDLDPGPGADLTDCCRVALLIRDRLAADGLTAHPKTSGSKGLHLYAALPPTPAARVGGYARALAETLAREHPTLVVARMAKALRSGRVFVDWSQNATAKTTAAPYTLRATAVPGVSTPLAWTEVEQCGSPDDLAFSPEQVLARVAEHGDLLAGLLERADPLPPE
ncbi:non-homologous end-joining DNA ligase [Kitasatospora paracochleata]|uniref:Bifunctional non-homologous end joining protein LigD n=1 Tax=Kitasatospora paracochleata TaxID=58354 RepID=A0ABT1J3G0_9ACTN|nr:non-homologous end-joining DNA ligase [Kitasatospora paracochleata]MCP2311276.1 bifunctional non-homologous end joining protein LigD [Kitasatospora paracochleata]